MKRFLAEHKIGNPLNKLFYSNKEIEEMKSCGIISNIRPAKKYKITPFRLKLENKGKWAIQVGKLVVEKVFETQEEASKWADWNYKGRGEYRIILL